MRKIPNLLPELHEIFNANGFSNETGLQFSQAPEETQREFYDLLKSLERKVDDNTAWVVTREIPALKQELACAEKVNACTQAVIDLPDHVDPDEKLSRRMALKRAEMELEVIVAKREANDEVQKAIAEYQRGCARLSERYRSDKKQRIYVLLMGWLTMLRMDPAEVANRFHMDVAHIGDDIMKQTKDLIPWLQAFEKAMHRRIRELEGSPLKLVDPIDSHRPDGPQDVA